MKNNIVWKLMDKNKEIRKLGLSTFIEKYQNEILIDILKNINNNDNKDTPKYLKKVSKKFKKGKYLNKLYNKAVA